MIKMELKKIKIGNKEVMPFTIPSGIITTQVSTLVKIAKEIPEIGILTTKSIGPVPREGNREPVISQRGKHDFINAVGLTNPGAEEFANQLASADFPGDKFLLISIFGGNEEEFANVAKILDPYADGFELNLSCPHAKGYGMQLGQDPEIVAKLIKAVCEVTDKPVFAKLTPNADNLEEIAMAAKEAGAYGLTAINTVGPGEHQHDGKDILTNKVGGKSGRDILPIGIECVKKISSAGLPIIGMGGIATAADIEKYADAGASIFGIGSVLAGMTDSDLRQYFAALVFDLNNSSNDAEGLLKTVDMSFTEFKIKERVDVGEDFKIFKMDKPMKAKPGQYVFLWIPGKGEKPFSVLDDDPFTIGILCIGTFTNELKRLNEGDSLYARGPYGQVVDVPEGSNVVLVGGGCGIAGIYLLAKEFSKKADITIVLGGRSADRVGLVNEFKKFGEVHIATDDGSLGKKGFVSDVLNELKIKEGTYFFNCGPIPMTKAILPIEKKYSGNEKIFSSYDYPTKCGVGLCGACADKNGTRTCIEGPFMNDAE